MLKIAIILLLAVTQTSYASVKNNLTESAILEAQAKVEQLITKDQLLREELLSYQQKSPHYLENHPKLLDKLKKLDQENTDYIKNHLFEWGWPDKKVFGEKYSKNFWLLVQHADQDVEFQRQALKALKEIVSRDASERNNFAYLWDRVKMHDHLPQRYGTQGMCKERHHWEPFPLEDKLHINNLRKSVGLGKFEDYKQLMNKICF